jgi:hypothetical protein
MQNADRRRCENRRNLITTVDTEDAEGGEQMPMQNAKCKMSIDGVAKTDAT